VEWNTLLSQITDPESRDFDAVVMAWTVDFRVDETDLFHSDAVDGQLAFSGTRNPRIDALIDSLDVTRDGAERQRLWASYQEVLSEEQPYTWFYFPQRLDGVRSRLRGAVMDARGEWVTIHRWRLDPAKS
jgi:peptide/nickel transport system substrate-binding protein